ncbi:MAG TPA: lysylphosphatidylglycerol synthase transmembrane domain-containing protein [Gaiellaceae bacterium]|nr:lysylphosphatidylglycerol synthase transmembrane domain-containing protein [Gaiellaceae bacterium]
MTGRLTSLRQRAVAHPRLVVALEFIVGAVFIVCIAWAVRGSFRAAGKDLRNANLGLFGLACAVLAVYYLAFVVGWIRIFHDWGIRLSYPTALRAEMVSMLAKYVPGGVWTPAARVVAMRRSGVNSAGLVTAAMAIEAGLSAVSGVMVFVISLAWVDGVHAPIVPLVAFAIVVAALVQPRVFRPLMARILRRFGYKEELPPLRPLTMAFLLVYYSATWVIGGAALWLLLRAVGAHPDPETIVYLGGVAAVGAIVAVLVVIAPSGLGVREGTMYGLMLAVAPKGAALGATLLNRVAITLVELLLLLVGGAILRARGEADEDEAMQLRDAQT